MKRLAAIAAVAVLAVACTETDQQANPPNQPFGQTTTLSEDINVELFRTLIDGTHVLTDNDIVEFGDNVCTLARSSNSRLEFLELMIEANSGSGLSDYDAGEMIGAALGLWCPNQVERLDLAP